MATIRYAVQNNRREQMKRELIGLVIGTSLLMAGMAFLFSQTLVASSPGASNAKADVEAKPASAAAKPVTEPAAVTPPPLVAAIPVADASASKADIPALASLDIATSNLASVSVNTPEPATTVMPETKTVEAQTTEVVAPTESEALPAEEKVDVTATGSTGWIYAGQFANGKWAEQGLKIGAELPVTGNKYPLSWSATVREHAPGKQSQNGSKLGKVTGNLAAGREVEVVQVKKSGSKGHVWLEIRYQ